MSEELEIVKKKTKVVIEEKEYTLDRDMSIDELLEIIREQPGYEAATKDNLFEEDGVIDVGPVKSPVNG